MFEKANCVSEDLRKNLPGGQKTGPLSDMARRFAQNPLLHTRDITPSHPGLKVECLLNPGVFRFDGKIWLVLRVAERPVQQEGRISFPILENGRIKILEFAADDPDLNTSDPREYKYQGVGYLSTLSHLRLVCSDDGEHFYDPGLPPMVGQGDYESYGIEDCRVASIADGEFLLTYTAVSPNGYGVGLRRTRDWKSFEHCGLIALPPNKDCALFSEKIAGHYACFSRPSGIIVGGHYIWYATSSNLKHWGDYVCVAKPRPGRWDSTRVGAGAAPIKTDRGWLEIYHGAGENNRYSLGAMLMDLERPWIVRARSQEPIMEPIRPYETNGFMGHVIFTNGHLVDGDELTIYYGASDTVVCGAHLSISQILESLQEGTD